VGGALNYLLFKRRKARGLPKAGRKNIKIASKKIFLPPQSFLPFGYFAPSGRLAFNFFAPFNLLWFDCAHHKYFKEKERCQVLQKKKLIENPHRKSISGLSDDLMLRLYSTLFLFFSSQR